MRVFGLIGQPLTHSFSGQYFTEKFRTLGLFDHQYNLYPLPDLSGFLDWVRAIDGLVGLNVTIPYKKSILPFLDETHLPAGLDACNCLHLQAGKLVGFNTDVIGFSESLQPLLRPHHDQALILGHGGAAEAVCFVLNQLHIPYRIVGRKAGQGVDLTYSDLSVEVVRGARLIIQTTPLGTYPNIEEYPAIPYEAIGSEHLLYDLVYNPAKSRFLGMGAARGATIKNGEEMLVLQAEASWRIWNAESVS